MLQPHVLPSLFLSFLFCFSSMTAGTHSHLLAPARDQRPHEFVTEPEKSRILRPIRPDFLTPRSRKIIYKYSTTTHYFSLKNPNQSSSNPPNFDLAAAAVLELGISSISSISTTSP
jgi:hypothetical protein